MVNGMLQVIGGLVLAAPASCEFTSVAALRLVNVGNVYSPLFMWVGFRISFLNTR